MNLESDTIVFENGAHNAFTSLVRWREAYWLSFRTASDHRSHDGKILVISSTDLRHWTEPTLVIDSDGDDRDAVLFVWNDKLFASSVSQKRVFEHEESLIGDQTTTQAHSVCAFSDDGLTWSESWVASAPFHYIWWAVPRGEAVYATQRGGKKWIEDGETRRMDGSTFWKSVDGRTWEKIGTISDEECATETAFDFLPDGRAVAFVRHDCGSRRSEIKISEPPYNEWSTVITFPFVYQGPCLKVANGTIVIAGRIFAEESETPLQSRVLKERLRGLLVMTVNVDAASTKPELLIPHSTGPTTIDGLEAFPDISYAGILNLGDNKLAMSYYEGYKIRKSWIRVAVLSL